MQRDSYRDVGQATRGAIERAMRAEVGPLELRVLVAVMHELTTFSWLSRELSAKALARIVYARREPSGGQRERVSRALTSLGVKGVLIVEPGRGRTAVTRVGLPTTCSPDDTNTAEIVFSPEHDSDRNRVVDARETCSRGELNVFPPRGNIEKYFEDSFEQRRDDVVARVLDRIVDTRINGREVRNLAAYRSTLRKQLDVEIDRDRLARIVDEHPGAPIEMLAGAALGESTPYLRNFRKATIDGSSDDDK